MQIQSMLSFFFTLLTLMGAPAAAQVPDYEMHTPEEIAKLEQSLLTHPPKSFCGEAERWARQAAFLFPTPWPQRPDFLLLDKQRRLLHIFASERLLATYQVALGAQPRGHKEREGDNRTPEGFYFFEMKNRRSDYHLALRINYPNSLDRERSKQRGIKDPGKDIMIHGLPNSWFKRRFIKHPHQDWTRGCAAVTDEEIESLFTQVDLGTLIEICP
ncbi:MAG: L,D-transpeptidase family protein [Bdellovibrio sp.]